MSDITIKIQVGSIAIEVSGEEKYVERKIDELTLKYLSTSQSSEKNEKQKTITDSATTKRVAPSEFVRAVAPKTQTDKALLLSFYLEKYEGMESFSTTNLSEICSKAKQSPFTNISDSVSSLVSQGFLMGSGDRDGKRAYSLTTTGEEQVKKLIENKK